MQLAFAQRIFLFSKRLLAFSRKSSKEVQHFLQLVCQLKPTTWKSESQLNKKENIRAKSEETRHGESIFYTKPLSKSSDWTEVDLEVPSKDDEQIHLRNPKLSLIFDNENGTPTPPPRKQPKRSNFREKIERIANKSLQAFQGDKNKDTNKVPVEEPLMVKREINYKCPVCDSDEKTHNRDHHHHNNVAKKSSESPVKSDSTKKSKSSKRQKNLSVISLPNYNDLKLSVAHPDGGDQPISSKNELTSSRLSLQHPGAKKLTNSQSTGKLDSYITRCRSFGSIFPQQLKKLKMQKTKPEDITSDDSFGPLEDWDVGLIEHYDPKDTSLPRPRKAAIADKKSDKEVLDGIAGLIVNPEDIPKPERPVRRAESLVKKINKEASVEAAKLHSSDPKAPEEICLTPPPSPIHDGKSTGKKVAQLSRNFEDPATATKLRMDAKPLVVKRNKPEKSAVVEKRESVCEHSSLMKILQEFSIKDKQEKANVVENESTLSSLTPSLVEFEKTLNNNVLEDFINAEKNHSRVGSS
ncbi:hypothetical protein YQE_08256, partial [Dendroctonus ponderosae]